MVNCVTLAGLPRPNPFARVLLFENSPTAMKPLLLALLTFVASFAMAGTMPPTGGRDPVSEQQSAAAENLRRALPSLREGDVIFTRARHALYRRISETSGSWESHVGIILRDADGAWIVAESTVPVSRFSPIERFVARSENGRFLVRRLRGGLTGEEVRRLCRATERRMGKLYDTGFQYDSSRQFCSKFVYDSYVEATGQPVGKLETFREMLAENPEAPVKFWRAWFFGRIPWDRRCVTTASQLRAPNMVTVFDSEIRTRSEEPGRHSSPTITRAALW